MNSSWRNCCVVLHCAASLCRVGGQVKQLITLLHNFRTANFAVVRPMLSDCLHNLETNILSWANQTPRITNFSFNIWYVVFIRTLEWWILTRSHMTYSIRRERSWWLTIASSSPLWSPQGGKWWRCKATRTEESKPYRSLGWSHCFLKWP